MLLVRFRSLFEPSRFYFNLAMQSALTAGFVLKAATRGVVEKKAETKERPVIKDRTPQRYPEGDAAKTK